jgi:hypothetical protein
MANELTRESVGDRYHDARRLSRLYGGHHSRRHLLWAGAVQLQRLIGRTRLPYSDGVVRMLGVVWLVAIFVAVLWDLLPAR